ncbi:MAG: hypothetical protein OXR72_07530 [Gemmatimonadota bacterium]|nr:hypothetical protein [Gemmatimonadota bacterium]
MDLVRESSFARYLTRQGIAQGLRKSILAVLDFQFGLPSAHPLAARIENVDETTRSVSKRCTVRLCRRPASTRSANCWMKNLNEFHFLNIFVTN